MYILKNYQKTHNMNPHPQKKKQEKTRKKKQKKKTFKFGYNQVGLKFNPTSVTCTVWLKYILSPNCKNRRELNQDLWGFIENKCKILHLSFSSWFGKEEKVNVKSNSNVTEMNYES